MVVAAVAREQVEAERFSAERYLGDLLADEDDYVLQGALTFRPHWETQRYPPEPAAPPRPADALVAATAALSITDGSSEADPSGPVVVAVGEGVMARTDVVSGEAHNSSSDRSSDSDSSSSGDGDGDSDHSDSEDDSDSDGDASTSRSGEPAAATEQQLLGRTDVVEATSPTRSVPGAATVPESTAGAAAGVQGHRRCAPKAPTQSPAFACAVAAGAAASHDDDEAGPDPAEVAGSAPDAASGAAAGTQLGFAFDAQEQEELAALRGHARRLPAWDSPHGWRLGLVLADVLAAYAYDQRTTQVCAAAWWLARVQVSAHVCKLCACAHPPFRGTPTCPAVLLPTDPPTDRTHPPPSLRLAAPCRATPQSSLHGRSASLAERCRGSTT